MKTSLLLFALGVVAVKADFPAMSERGWCEDAHEALWRMCPAHYEGFDGVVTDCPNPRFISITISQGDSAPSSRWFSNMLWQWGQFLDHDIDLTEGSEMAGTADILLGSFSDPDFEAHGCDKIEFTRSDRDGTEQINDVTPLIDGSAVYGSCPTRAKKLRALECGRMKTSGGGLLLPKNTYGLENAGGAEDENLFAAGDIRANEQMGLTAIHTLFVREHNRLAAIIKEKFYPDVDCAECSGDDNECDNNIYGLARKIVAALMQMITYKEFLPALLGNHCPDVHGNHHYDPSVNPQIANEFSTAAYRFGHTLVNHLLLGDLRLMDAFFNPGGVTDDFINRYLNEILFTECKDIDVEIVSDLQHLLFGGFDTTNKCLDLLALNIQRGRDHGLQPCNQMRRDLHLGAHADFSSITKNSAVAARLAIAYDDNIEKVDAFVCVLAEDPHEGSALGELGTYIIRDQFTRLMKGDPWFYKRDPMITDLPSGIMNPGDWTLASVIHRNTGEIGLGLDPARNAMFTHGNSGSWGDPHFRDWAGGVFDFHGECDLVLGDAPSFNNGQGLTVHVRTTRRYQYSYIDSAAIKIGNEVFEVAGFGEYFLNGVEGAELPATVGGYKVYHSPKSNKKRSYYIVEVGDDSNIVFSTYKDLVRVDWDISGADAAGFTDITGIMGSWHNGTHLARDGETVIEDFNKFGIEWQVRDTDPTLFESVREPQFPTMCRMPVPSSESRRLGENAVTKDQANFACAHLEGRAAHHMCVFDVISTQDVGVAQQNY